MSKRRQKFIDPTAQIKPAKSPSERMDFLLGDVCVKLGFCGDIRRATIEDFVGKTPVSKEAFAEFILECEGMDPKLSTHRTRLMDEFEAEFGQSFTLGD